MSLDPIIWQLKRTITQWGKGQPGNGPHTISTVHSSTFYHKERNHQKARSPALVCIVKLGCQLLWICNQLRDIALEGLTEEIRPSLGWEALSTISLGHNFHVVGVGEWGAELLACPLVELVCSIAIVTDRPLMIAGPRFLNLPM